jgi:hypothetical protein
MASAIEQSFYINLIVRRAFGLYPPDKHKYFYKLHAFLMYFAFIIPVPLFGCLYLLLDDNVDLTKVAENAFLLAEMGCYIAKFLPFIVNGDQIKECIHYFDSPFFTVFGDAQKKILNDCKKTCKRITTIFLVSVTGALSSWAVKPLFWKDYRLPIDVWFPLDPTSRLTIYSLIYTYLVIGKY